MLGIGLSEMMIVAAVALLVVGPERLPKVLRELGRWYGQARRAADDLRRAFVLEADRQDASARYQQLQQRRRQAEIARKEARRQADGADDIPRIETGSVAQSHEIEGPPEDANGDAPTFDENADAPDAPHPTHPVPPRADPPDAPHRAGVPHE